MSSARSSGSAAPSARVVADAASMAHACSDPSDRLILRSLLDRVVVPELLVDHAAPLRAAVVADPRVVELAGLLVAAEPKAAFALIDVLGHDGRSISQLCAGLLEPAARALGDLWQADDCTEVEVTLGLSTMQVALRRLTEGSSLRAGLAPTGSIQHAVLVAPSPHESHVLGSAIASEMFWQAGWDVSCAFPKSDAALNRLLHERWFDVLELSLSNAHTREHRLPAMAASIRAAHASSLNPKLIVIVDGRVFHEHPQAFVEVGADAGTGSAIELVPSDRECRDAQEEMPRKSPRHARAGELAGERQPNERL